MNQENGNICCIDELLLFVFVANFIIYMAWYGKLESSNKHTKNQFNGKCRAYQEDFST